MPTTIWDEADLKFVLSQSKKIGTPFYYFDADKLCGNINQLRQRFPKSVKICYSVKANPWFAKAALRCADYLELCSAGELHICERENIPLSRISVGGVSKTYEECEEIARLNPRRVSVESMRQIRMLAETAQKEKTSINVLLRLTSGNQFGMTAEEIINIIDNAKDYPCLNFKGIHYYSGTQKRLAAKVEKDISHICGVLELLKDKISEVEYGAGIGVQLFEERSAEGYEACLDLITSGLGKIACNYDVVFESGRLLTADTGVYVTSIVDIKNNDGKTYWIVDGGINHLSYYGQLNGKPFPFLRKYPDNGREKYPVTICGSLCTVSDILVNNIEMTSAEYGDTLVFMNAGAYSVTEARSLFLSRDLPVIVCCENGNISVFREKTSTYLLNSFGG